MKNTVLFVFALLISTFTFAQNDKYTAAMKTAIGYLEEDGNWLLAANTFERIAKAADTEWLPQYYLSKSCLGLAWAAAEQDNWDAFDANIDKAYAALEAAKELAGKNAELLTMEAYIYQGRIVRNPMINGPRFSGTVDGLLAKARELAPNNPRPYYLQGQQTLNMPSFLGGGAENALPFFEKAAERFESFEPASELHPNWGKAQNERMIGIAKERM